MHKHQTVWIDFSFVFGCEEDQHRFQLKLADLERHGQVSIFMLLKLFEHLIGAIHSEESC